MNKNHLVWICIFVVGLGIGAALAPSKRLSVEKAPNPQPEFIEAPQKFKITEVKIPQEYIQAKIFSDAFDKAPFIEGDATLAKVDSLIVNVALDSDLKANLTEKELKDSVELALRKNGIPVKSESQFVLELVVETLWNDNQSICYYSSSLHLTNVAYVWRDFELKRVPSIVWRTGYIGYAAKNKAGEGVQNSVDKMVISFSNAFLARNSK